MHIKVVRFLYGIITINRLHCSEETKRRLINQLIKNQIKGTSDPHLRQKSP